MDYECSDKIKTMNAVFNTISYLCWPLAFQSVFIGIMCRLSHIQIIRRKQEAALIDVSSIMPNTFSKDAGTSTE